MKIREQNEKNSNIHEWNWKNKMEGIEENP